MTPGPVVKISERADAKGSLVLSCFPSVSMVSSIVAHYLIEHMDLTFVGGVRDERLPPVCMVQNGKPLPPIRIYSGKPVNSKICDKIILIVSEMKVHDSITLPIAESLLEWSKEMDFQGGILIDAFARKGLEGNSTKDEPMVEYDDTPNVDVLGVGATDKMLDKLDEMEVTHLEQGVLSGMNAVLLGEGRRRGLDIMALLVEADPRYPDARAAAKLIELLDKLLPNIKLDTEPLIEEAERIEKQIKSMMESRLQPGSTEGSESANNMLYG